MDDVAETAEATDAVDAPQPDSLDDALGGDGALIDEIEQSLASEPVPGPTATKLELGELTGQPGGGQTMRDLDLLADVEVEVAVEFGRTRIPLRQLLTLRPGALVELSRRPEQQVTVLANGTPIALGDVVVVDDQVGVHIVELIDPKPPALTPEEMSLPLTEVRGDPAPVDAVYSDDDDPDPDLAESDGTGSDDTGGAT